MSVKVFIILVTTAACFILLAATVIAFKPGIKRHEERKGAYKTNNKEEDRRIAISKFYRVYRQAQQLSSLRMHSHFSLYDDGLIEIWEYRGEQKTRSICKIKEESETECYKRAAKAVESYIKSRSEKQ